MVEYRRTNQTMKVMRIHLLYSLPFVVQAAVTDEVFAMEISVRHNVVQCCLLLQRSVAR